jgi:hypothetical protein
MQPITNFSIFKNNFKEKDVKEKGLNEEEAKKIEDYTLSAKVITSTKEEYKNIGRGYINETKNEKKTKFIGVALDKDYTDKEGVEHIGYVVITTKQYKALKQAYDDWQIAMNNPSYPTPTSQGIDLNKTLQPDTAFDVTPEMLDINPDDIPF